MSTIGKSQVSQSKTGNNPLVKSTISKAEAIQQREQLRQKVLSILLKDYAKNSKSLQSAIEQEVDHFFKHEKVNESSLKDLKARVQALVLGKAPSSVGAKSVNQNAHADDNKSVRSQVSQKSHVSGVSQKNQQQNQNQYQQHHDNVSHRDDDGLSATSSKAPQSVYYLEGDEDDEWAAIVKFDTELFKKEQDLEKQRNAEFKKKMRNELDKQLAEKGSRKVHERVENDAYVDLQNHQLNVYDEREKQKEQEKQAKIMNEKRQRDKQVQDENLRRKLEKKREKELDAMLVNKIKEEKELEEKEILNKKLREKERLAQMMKENEDFRIKSEKEAREEKANDIRLQQEYTRLTEEMEANREREKKNREDKIKKIMSAFADTVVKDQKAIIREEDEKMMRHIIEQEEKDRQEELRKQENLRKQKQDMRSFLNKQIDEKNDRKVQEDQINKKQAEIWAKDRENYMEHEQNKQTYIKTVNKKHQDILKQQMDEKQNPKKGKMNVNELLQNKQLFEEIAQKNDKIQLKKADPSAIKR
ncbi:hypothetical protein ABPG74_015321 [Tetrahymena malaccensis]